MLLAYLLICQLLKITYGINSPVDEDLYVFVSKESAEAGLAYMTRLANDLNDLIGDNKQMIIEDFDPSSLVSMKNLMHGTWTISDMHMLSGEITRTARLAIQWPVGGRRDYENDTSLDALLERMKEGYSEINRRLYDLRSIETSVPFWKGPQFDLYVKIMEKITYVGDKWAAWSYVPSQVTAYEQFLSSCHKYLWGLKEWQLGVTAATNEQYNDGSHFLNNRRKAIIQIGRLIKLDFCRASLLLGACDEVRQQVGDQSIRMNDPLRKYWEFGEAYIPMEKVLVTNAREDITKDTKAILSRQMDVEYPEGYECDFLSSVAQNITDSLKDRFFWLEFAVIVIDGRLPCCDGGTCRNHFHMTEYSPEKECPCMISTGPMSPPSKPLRKYQALVNVADRPSEGRRDWRRYRRSQSLWNNTVVGLAAESERCTLKQNSICDAHDFFVETTNVDTGVPTASYFATVYFDSEDDRTIYFAETNKRRYYQVNVCYILHLYDPLVCGNRSVSVISAAPCDNGIYEY